MSIGIRLLRAFGQILLGLLILGLLGYGIEVMYDGGSSENEGTIDYIVMLTVMLPTALFLILGWFQLARTPKTRAVTGFISGIVAALATVAAISAYAVGVADAPGAWIITAIGAAVTTIVMFLYWKKPGTAFDPASARHAPAQPGTAPVAGQTLNTGRILPIIAAVGLVAVFVACLLPWYGSSGSMSDSLGSSYSAELSANGFQMSPWGILALLAAAVGLVLSFLSPLRKATFVPFVAAALFTLPVVLAPSDSMSASAEVAGISGSASASAGPMLGSYIALAGGLVVAIVSLVMTMRKAGQSATTAASASAEA